MPDPRRLCGVLGAGAVLLMLAAVPTLRAEFVYGRARGYEAPPAEDLPGRLEAYREAARIAPSEFAYPFRIGQILLHRDRTDEALAALERAARAQPLDPRVHATLAEVHLKRADVESAVEESERARTVGPRHARVQSGAMELRLRLWATTREVSHLGYALDAMLAADALGADAGVTRVARMVRAAGDRGLLDLLQTASFHAAGFRRLVPVLVTVEPRFAPALEAEVRRLDAR